jgi:hypothetical protein
MPALASAFGVNSRPSGGGFAEDESAFVACEDLYRRKFRHWRGRSGRSYVFSVYAPSDCPAYENAVLLATARRGVAAGALACVDLGALPEARLVELRRLFEDRLGEIDFQIHVLAERRAERASLIEDISPRAA